MQEEGENLSVRTQPTRKDAYIESDGLMKQASCQAAAGVEGANGAVMEARLRPPGAGGWPRQK